MVQDLRGSLISESSTDIIHRDKGGISMSDAYTHTYTTLLKNRKSHKSALLAEKLFPYLQGYIHFQKSTIFYETCAEQLGYFRKVSANSDKKIGFAKMMPPILGHLYHWCRSKGYPASITAIVVRKATGKPGWEAITESEMQKCLGFDWYDVPTPTAYEMSKIWKSVK